MSDRAPSGKVISLSKARKARDRAARKRQADANSVRHGQTARDRTQDAATREKTERDLSAHRREDPPEDP